MAYQFIEYWHGYHDISSELHLAMRYAVYSDLSDYNSIPYLLLDECEVRTAQYKYNSVNLASKLPMTIRLQIGVDGSDHPMVVGADTSYVNTVTSAVYSFATGTTISHRSGRILDLDYNLYSDEFYYTSFSSSTHIQIPRDALKFTINLTVKTKNNAETYTVVEHASGPISNALTGSSNIYTGKASTYTLARSIKCEGNGSIGVNYGDHLLSGAISFRERPGTPGYVNATVRAEAFDGNVNKIGFACTKNYGESSGSSFDGTVIIKYIYHSSDLTTADLVYNYYDLPSDHKLTLMSLTKTASLTIRDAVDSDILPTYISSNYISYAGGLDVNTHVSRYGGCVQNKTMYGYEIHYQAKYGLEFKTFVVNDYKNGSLYRSGVASISSPYERTGVVRFAYSGGVLDKAISGGSVEYIITDYFGNVTRHVDTVNVIKYSPPSIPVHNARRCVLADGSSGTDCYTYNQHTYKLNENGDYALIEWSVSISPLRNVNSKSFKILDTESNRTIPIDDYSESGYYVVPADPETSYDIVFSAYDDFYDRTPVTATFPLNTAISAIDFLSGGTGLSFGKVAEYDHTMDIHRNWTIHMPYDTLVMNYNQNGTSVRLYDWINTTSSRIQSIIDSRKIMIVERVGFTNKLYDDNTITCVPSSNGYIDTSGLLSGDTSHYYTMHANTSGTAGMVIGDHITISRNYLYVYIGSGYSYINADPNIMAGTYPTIYIMGTKPTTIDQSTGVPNGTVLKTVSIPWNFEYLSGGPGYCHIYPRNGSEHNIDVSSLRGRNVWLVITARGGPNFNYAGITISWVYQTNTRT